MRKSFFITLPAIAMTFEIQISNTAATGYVIEVSGSIYHVSRRKGPRLAGSDTKFKATYNTK